MSRLWIVVAVTVCMQMPASASDWVEDGDMSGQGGGARPQAQAQDMQQQPSMQGQPMMQGQPGMQGLQYKRPKKSLLKRLSGDDDDDDDTMFGGMGFPATGGMRTTQTYNTPFASGTVTTTEEGFGSPMFAGTEVPVPTYGVVNGVPMAGTQYMGVPGMPGTVLGAPPVVPYGGVYGGGYGGYGYPAGYGYGASPLNYAVGGLLNRFGGARNVYGNGAYVGPGGNVVEPNGSVITRNGNIVTPGGAVVTPGGGVINGGGYGSYGGYGGITGPWSRRSNMWGH